MDQPKRAAALAPHHMRMLALMLDYIFIVTVIKLVDQLTLGEHWDLQPIPEVSGYFTLFWLGGTGLMLLLKDATGGRSLGKWLTGLAVVRASDAATPPTLAQGLLRNLFLLLLPVEAVAVFLDVYYRRMGDRVAGTVVVIAPKVPPLARRWTVVAIFFMALLLSSFLIAPWNMSRSAVHQTASAAALTAPDLVREVGEPVELEETKLFELSMPPKGDSDAAPREGRAVVTFAASGPSGEAQARVELRLKFASATWRVEEVTVTREKPEEETQPAPSQEGVQPAPPREDIYK